MPEKMIIEMPLPMPRSVTCSPSHIRNSVPVTSVATQVILKAIPGEITRCMPATVCCSSMIDTPVAWNTASTTVK